MPCPACGCPEGPPCPNCRLDWPDELTRLRAELASLRDEVAALRARHERLRGAATATVEGLRELVDGWNGNFWEDARKFQDLLTAALADVGEHLGREDPDDDAPATPSSPSPP